MSTLICTVAVTALAADKPSSVVPEEKDRGRHDQFMKDKEEAMKKGPVGVVFIGDSITDAWRGGEPNEIFNKAWGAHNPYNIGISGDKTQHVLWRLDNGEIDGLKPKAVVLMIGTNNLGNPPQSTPEETAEGVKAVVAKIHEKLPESKILLLAIFPRGREANDPFRAQIKTVNESLAKLDDGKKIKFLDIGAKFIGENGRLPDDIMPDALHLSPAGYQIWADAIGAMLAEMVK